MAEQFRIPTWCIVFDGQSLNLTPLGDSANTYPYLVMTGRTSAFVKPELTCISATSWTKLTLTAAFRSFPHADDGASTLLSMLGGTSDVKEGDSAATIYAEMKDYAVAARAAGFDKILACTITPSTSFTAGENVERKAVNNLLIGNADGAWEAVVDLASDSSLSDPGAPPSGTTWYGTGNLSDPDNTTYYPSGPDWSAAAAADAAVSIGPAITALGAT
jgi:hypothetical protein